MSCAIDGLKTLGAVAFRIEHVMPRDPGIVGWLCDVQLWWDDQNLKHGKFGAAALTSVLCFRRFQRYS